LLFDDDAFSEAAHLVVCAARQPYVCTDKPPSFPKVARGKYRGHRIVSLCNTLAGADEVFTIVVGFTQKALDSFSKEGNVLSNSMLGGDIQGVLPPIGGVSHNQQVLKACDSHPLRLSQQLRGACHPCLQHVCSLPTALGEGVHLCGSICSLAVLCRA
jgi:hypothetical protein